jgi:hypothetical protein
MEIGFSVVSTGNPRQVDNKGAERSVSLCQIGLRWLRELLNDGLSPPLFTVNFGGKGWLKKTIPIQEYCIQTTLN